MPITLDQHKQAQADSLALQRLALRYSELDERVISLKLQDAALRVSKLRPAKPAANPPQLQPQQDQQPQLSVVPADASPRAAKGKGA